MNRPSTVRTLLLAAGCTLALVCGLVSTPALAYFTAGGSGTATAAAGTLQPLIVLPATTDSSTGPLYPGGTGDLILNVTNPNSKQVRLQRVSQAGGVGVQGGFGCTGDPGWPNTVGNSGVSILDINSLNVLLPGGSTQVLHLRGAAAMSVISAAACQGASFDVPVTIEVSE
ncbi:hypothetical protein IV500_15910 [Paeniglutamicibacter antarcticus]|uniref:Secreted protein n=1 Tax=Arthrobacter terrae TaxID=2935737 RepID=A0A931G5H6_9MICC|nr:hypothetical protein [Arthrobacter terrae]MBG0740861.1 hypothetical protein [Arthrobacter terrae]